MKKTPQKKSRPKGPSKTRKSARIPVATVQKLRANTLFTGVESRRVSAILSKATVRRYAVGDAIFNESTKGNDLFLIADGVVRIKKITSHGFESLLAVLHDGDFFGELSIIDGSPRSARAEAARPCTIARIRGIHFRSLFQRDDTFARNMLHNLVRRLRTMDHAFVGELDRHSLSTSVKMEKLHLLIEASKIVNSTLELDKLLVVILEAASRSISADRGTLYLIDEKSNELWSKALQGRDMIEIRLPIGKGLAGYVAKTGETVNIKDAYNDPRFNPEIDRRSGYATRNVLCMPMKDKTGKIVGVFQFLNKKGEAFTGEDESFIDAFSVHAAIAIDNAHLAREMMQNERLSAVGRMAGTIIHDIKNPLSTLRMYAQVFKSKMGDAEGAQMADDMIGQVDRFVNMTQEILDFSRGGSEMRLEIVDLAGIMETAMRFIRMDAAKKNVTLVSNFRYEGKVKMDVEKILRVFYNLSGNAADAMPEGGTLIITTEKKDDSVKIAFSDMGGGIPAEIRSRIFDPFFSHGKRHGTGLGLAIVKKIIDDHKGTIEISSEPGRGTTISLFLPLQEQ